MYKTILIDPPWKLCTGGSKSLAVHTHYPFQTQKEILLTVENWVKKYPIAKNAHCYIWSINSYSSGGTKGIESALQLMRFLDFKPITNIIWTKDNSNPTPYGQRGVEICIFGARWEKGKHKKVMYKGDKTNTSVAKPTLSKSIDWFKHPRGRHSEKPNVFYDIIESRSNSPYLELYARKKRKGWTSLGNEITKEP